MFNVKKIMAREVVRELNQEIRRYQDMHGDAYIKATKAKDENDRKRADDRFDAASVKLEALYELKGELRAKGYL